MPSNNLSFIPRKKIYQIQDGYNYNEELKS